MTIIDGLNLLGGAKLAQLAPTVSDGEARQLCEALGSDLDRYYAAAGIEWALTVNTAGLLAWIEDTSSTPADV